MSWGNAKYQALESQFQQLDHEQKKQKIINIMDYVKDKIDFAGEMSDFIEQSTDVSDEFLQNMYQLIMKSAIDTTQKQESEHSQKMLDHIKNIILKNVQLDEQEHQAADKLLDQI